MYSSGGAMGDDAKVLSSYDALIKTFAREPGVTLGGGKRGFGANALQVNGKIFAMLTSKQELVVKLPKARVQALVDQGAGTAFDMGNGRVMKEWFVISAGSLSKASALAREAMQFVGATT
jgi:hypothetical protein